MKKDKVCIFSSDDRREAGAVRHALEERGVEVEVSINTRSDLFGIRTIPGPQVVLEGTYRLLVEVSDQEAALGYLPVILEQLDTESEYAIEDQLPGLFRSRIPADDADIGESDRWHLTQTLALGMLPLLGFGLVPFLRQGRKISRDNRPLRLRAILIPLAVQLVYGYLFILVNRLFGTPLPLWQGLSAVVSGHCVTSAAHFLTPGRRIPIVITPLISATVLLIWML
jgi:hypothetical protein